MAVSPKKKPVPVYLRGIPSDVVREAKARAARSGITLAKFVADTLARAMDPSASDADSSFHRDESPGYNKYLDVEASWFLRNRERLERQYAGEFIAIVNQRVVDHDVRFDALADRVFRLRGSRDTFMPEVKARAKTLHLRSPRLVRKA
jgi:hypothetical protein